MNYDEEYQSAGVNKLTNKQKKNSKSRWAKMLSMANEQTLKNKNLKH